MIRKAVLATLLAASPAMAESQAPMPAFDAVLIDACLAEADRATPDQPEPDRSACIGAASGPCMAGPDGGTTIGMSYCLGEELTVWDMKLNESYARVLKAAKATDAEMAELGSAAEQQEPLLRQMQRDWIAFRDSACAFERSRWGGGTGGGPAGVDCMVNLTARQYLRLRAYETPDG